MSSKVVDIGKPVPLSLEDAENLHCILYVLFYLSHVNRYTGTGSKLLLLSIILSIDLPDCFTVTDSAYPNNFGHELSNARNQIYIGSVNSRSDKFNVYL